MRKRIDKELKTVLDYCQNDLEFDNCVEYIIEYGAEGLTRDELENLMTLSDKDAEPILVKAAENGCMHIWAVAYRVRKQCEKIFALMGNKTQSTLGD